MKRLSMSLRTKLIILFVTLGAVPMLISNFITYLATNQEILHNAHERADLLASSKAKEVSSYYGALESSVLDLASMGETKKALREFSRPFEVAKVDPSSESFLQQRDEVKKFYFETFAAEYKTKQGADRDVKEVLAKLDPLSIIAQYDFIAKNENPLGKKNNLLRSSRSTPYADTHELYHPVFQKVLDHHALYDVFLVNAEGRVVYTVFKEIDFATSLANGPWSDTGLAKAFEQTKTMKEGTAHFQDYTAYLPSYDAPAGFVSSPLYDGDKYVGAVIVQFPIDKIVAMLSERADLGEKGDFYLVGLDGTLRSEIRRAPEKFNLKNQFAPGSKLAVNTAVTKTAFARHAGSADVASVGTEDMIEGASYDGLAVLADFKAIKLGAVDWILIAELDRDEAYSALYTLQRNLIVLLLVSLAGIGFAAYFFGKGLSRSLSTISETLEFSSREVSSSSSQSAASSTELSEAATEQAASLQETMASIEEISAMVNQNAESASRAKVAVDANHASSEDGARSVEEMMRSISEIKTTNDDILAQMETSNKEFGEIVKIISDIGEKTTVINDIVFQTKLLSFNASVEAARAGEHGKGFAVVAEEVGNLAQMSGNAAREISEMLAQSIKRVNGIVEQTRDRVDQLVEVGKDKITMGQSTAQRCRDSLTKINENAKSMSSMISEITHASKEQAQGIQEINKAISQLDQVTQQNSAVAQQSSSQAEELHSQAAELQSAVSSLVELINGGQSDSDSKREVSESAHKAKILKMKPSKESKTAKALATKRPQDIAGKKVASVSHKKVSGSDIIPSSNDPGFEEF